MKVDNMYVIPNFLDDEEFVDIEKFICGKKTEWTYNPIKSRPETGVVSDDRTYHNQQMVKVYYNQKDYPFQKKNLNHNLLSSLKISNFP